MKNKVKKHDQSLLNPNKPRKRIGVLFVVALCIISDFICVYQFSGVVYDEYPFISVFVSLVLAVCLDASTAHAATLLNAHSSTTTEMRKRKVLAVGGMALVFLLAFGSLILIAIAAQSNDSSQNLAQSGTTARLILPVATSVLSFVMGWNLNPTASYVQQLKYQRTKLALELADAKANAQRMRSAMELIDPNAYDRELLNLALQKVKAATSEAQYKLRIALAEELGTTEASDMLKNSQDIVDIGQIQRQLEHQAERIDIAPTAEHHSGRFPESTRDNSSPSP